MSRNKHLQHTKSINLRKIKSNGTDNMKKGSLISNESEWKTIKMSMKTS
jgi:hypothetical protein